MVEFFLPMIPPTVTHQEHQVTVVDGKPRFYEPADLKAARMKFMALLARHAPEQKLDGPLRLITKWVWPKGGADGQIAMEGVIPYAWKITKPDTDNMIKLLKDCMTRTGYWNDDAQVASEVTEKFLGPQPGIYIRVEPLS